MFGGQFSSDVLEEDCHEYLVPQPILEFKSALLRTAVDSFGTLTNFNHNIEVSESKNQTARIRLA